MTTLTSSEEQQLQQLKAKKPGIFKRLLHGAVMALAVQGTVMQGPTGERRVSSLADEYTAPQYYNNDTPYPADTTPQLAIGMGGKRRRTKKGKKKHKKRSMKHRKKHGGRGRKRTNKRR